MSEKSFSLIADPGHAWLTVTFDDLADVGLTSKDITRYSYIEPETQTMWLEEDEDAGVFIRAYEAKHGLGPVIVTHFVAETDIRSKSMNTGGRVLFLAAAGAKQ